MVERYNRRLPFVVFSADCADERPESYAIQDGCHNCECVLRESEIDSGPVYYCLKCAVHPLVPLHNSETHYSYDWKANGHLLSNISFRYYENKTVYPWGKCKEWKEEVDE